jgi:hypothetical protein
VAAAAVAAAIQAASDSASRLLGTSLRPTPTTVR